MDIPRRSYEKELVIINSRSYAPSVRLLLRGGQRYSAGLYTLDGGPQLRSRSGSDGDGQTKVKLDPHRFPIEERPGDDVFGEDEEPFLGVF